jgi:hypothetical protein
MNRTLRQAGLLILIGMATGCGDGSGSGGPDGGSTPSATSGVAGNKTLGTLTDADKKAICDWTASLYGGYGKTIACGNVGGFELTIYAPESQAECLAEGAQMPKTCQVTVAQSETCVKAMADCDETNDMAVCMALFTCLPTAP